MKFPTMRHVCIPALVAGAILASGCANLPPEQTATDVKAISGHWVGNATGRFGSGASDFRISENGRYEASVAGWPASVGRVWVADGKYRLHSETRNIGGTLTLHEGNGERVLTTATDDGIRGEYRPAK